MDAVGADFSCKDAKAEVPKYATELAVVQGFQTEFSKSTKQMFAKLRGDALEVGRFKDDNTYEQGNMTKNDDNNPCHSFKFSKRAHSALHGSNGMVHITFWLT